MSKSVISAVGLAVAGIVLATPAAANADSTGQGTIRPVGAEDLAVTAIDTQDRTIVRLLNSNDGDDTQRWSYNTDNFRQYTISNVDSGKCLQTSLDEFGAVSAAACDGSDRQKFVVVRNAGGWDEIHTTPEECLGVFGPYAKSGAPLAVKGCYADSTRWRLEGFRY